jgi:hypothetical protein
MIAYLQPIGIAFTLLFGVLGVLAWRRLGADRWRKTEAGWLVTGACFTLVGFLGGMQAAAAAAALHAGEGSWLYRTFLEWSPVGNIGRGVGVVAYAVMLAALVASAPHRVRPMAVAAPWVIGAALAAGTVAAALYPPLSMHTQMTVLAVLMTASVVAMLLALLLGVMNDGMDLLLWMAVAAYTLKETVGVSLTTIIAWWDTARSVEAILLYWWSNVAVMAGACLLAWLRLRRAMQHRHVPALFERLHALRRPAES